MTDKQALYIKTFLEGAFPMLKESKESDLTYVVMLKEYDFETMFQATKNYIKKSVYTPTIAGIIQEYETLKAIKQAENQKKLVEIIDQMDDKKWFPPNDDFTKLSEYEKALEMVVDGNISDDLKKKILTFARNNNEVKLLLENNERKGEAN